MEPISFFLSTFTALTDKIVNLEKTKLQDKSDLFNNLVAPMFEDLEPVASKYIKFFQLAKRLVDENLLRDIKNVTRQLQNARDEEVLARIKVRQMAAQISKHIQDEDVVKFANAVTNFFNAMPEIPIPDLSKPNLVTSNYVSMLTEESKLILLLNWMADNNLRLSKNPVKAPNQRTIFTKNKKSPYAIVSITEIEEFINETLANLEQSWASVVQSYDKIKIYSVSAPKFIRRHKT